MDILEIGCGDIQIYHNSICLDREKTLVTNKVWDLEKIPLPFKNNFFQIIVANHILEHIRNFDELMVDLARILKPNGKLKLRVPYGQSPIAKHPYHVNMFSLNSFHSYWNMKYQKLFKIEKRKIVMGVTRYYTWLNFLNPFVNLSTKTQEFYELFLSSILPAQELQFELRKK